MKDNQSHTEQKLPFLQVNGLTQIFDGFTAYEDISFSLDAGDFLCIIGPSGCGKTTLLRSIGGFITPTRGHVMIKDVQVTSPGSECSMVFQTFDQLFPWKTVRGNVEYPLRINKKAKSKREANQLSQQYIDMVGLTAFTDRYPYQLSGGMKQRVAIARALALGKKTMLMDEPFASLDADSRTFLQSELKRIWKQTGITVLFITHSIIEAISLGTKILVMGKDNQGIQLMMDNPVEENPQRYGMRSPESKGYAEFWTELNRLIRGGGINLK